MSEFIYTCGEFAFTMKAYRDGKFICDMEKKIRTAKSAPSAKRRSRNTYWSCIMNGREIHSSTLAQLKRKIECLE